MTKKRIFFSVGEASGDLHASNLILDLKTIRPDFDFTFFGYGGPKMADVGCNLLEDLTQHAVMFLTGIFSKIAKFRRLLKQAEEVFKNQQVDLVVLIDYSGFNWHVARRAKKYGIPVVFYGIPQMWAWAPWRVRKMRKYVDLGICKLPFEKKWLEDRQCKAEYVGHPFFDEMDRQDFDQDFESKIRADLGEQELVTILPGSRRQELASNIPVFLRTAELVHKDRPQTQFVVSCLDDSQKEQAESIIREQFAENEFVQTKIKVFGGRTPELVRIAKCCLACSGSVSLELMYREKPTVIHYRLANLLFQLQKVMLRVKYITLVNLLWTDSIQRKGMKVYNPDTAGAENIPFVEYLTNADRANEMKDQIIRLLDDQVFYDDKKQMLRLLKEKYGQPGASSRAAKLLVDRFLDSKNSTTAQHAA